MSANAMFWDKMAAKYAASPVKDMAAYEATLARVAAHLKPEDDVLEIGCGTGTTALKLADTGAEFTSTDISAEMIRIAEEKRAKAGADNIHFVQATLSGHHFEPETYDAVLAFNLLHLLEDLPAALDEAYRLVKPDGLFISKTICLSEGRMLWKLMIPVMRLIGKAPYVRFMSSEELDALIEAAGFEIIETGYYPEKAKNRFVVARKPA